MFIGPARGFYITNHKYMKYFKGIWAEMHHVIWPKQETTWFYTILVIVIAFVVAYYLHLFDWIFEMLLAVAL